VRTDHFRGVVLPHNRPRTRALHLSKLNGGGAACVDPVSNPHGDCEVNCSVIPRDSRTECVLVFVFFCFFVFYVLCFVFLFLCAWGEASHGVSRSKSNRFTSSSFVASPPCDPFRLLACLPVYLFIYLFVFVFL
jgi:hypothetical protein